MPAMAGKRLVDVASVFTAARAVAKKHVALRQAQLDSYNKTSSLAQAIRSQTDRVTLTVRAASALRKRFDDDQVVYPARSTAQNRDTSSDAAEYAGSQATSGAVSSSAQELTYIASDVNTAAQPMPRISMRLDQAESTEVPSPDGITSLRHSDQRPSTRPEVSSSWNNQNTSEGTDFRSSEPNHDSIPGSTTTSQASEDQGQDVFYTATSEPSTESSQSPDLTIATAAHSGVESIDHSSAGSINSDIFLSHQSEQQRIANREEIVSSEPVEIPEDMYASLFQSPKVARSILGNQKTLDAVPGKPSSHDGVAENAIGIGTISGASRQDDAVNLVNDIINTASNPNSEPAVSPSTDDQHPSSTYTLRESRVPSSRIGRLWEYGGLATSMAFGAVSESVRRATGSPNSAGGSLILSATNMERLVAKLSKMRGAALKLGQMMSFQDSKLLPSQINEVLQRVQDSADFMPSWQRDQVLSSNLGPQWRDMFTEFEEKPIAAASIGQVHAAQLASTGQKVAVKIQYPGVASSIDSDLSNLSILLTASRLLPKGLFLDKTIANARTELAWECDYLREAEMGARFRNLLADEPDVFHVPKVFTEASGAQVLTAEFCEGKGVTKVQSFTQEQRDWIGSNILRLCLREITEFKFMQTDPNWTNFLYNAQSNRLELLDFGASRDYPDKFILPYIKTLLAASRSERAAVRDFSIQLGYLTGQESKAMLQAHVDSVLTLAEPFMETAPEVYDFRNQTITDRVRSFIPVMMRERLAPPPEETYSLHRKLSGAFLLCAKLGSRVRCGEMFANAMSKAGVI